MRQGGEKMLNAKKLKDKILENRLTVVEVAKKLGIDPATFYRKMKKNSFKICEVDAMVDALSLTRDDANDIFFSNQSQ